MGESQSGIRLYVEEGLSEGAAIGLGGAQAHYLGNVMRLRRGDTVALFNGRDGEWGARIDGAGRGWCSLSVIGKTSPQAPSPDLWLVFAPVKRARLDYIAAKATELGAAALWPVLTRHTMVSRVNTERLRANAIEAAEQCRRMDVPAIRDPVPLTSAIDGWPGDRRLLLCDETGGGTPIAEVLSSAEMSGPTEKWAIMTGPEGGFSSDEIDLLTRQPFVTPVGLGPRILRAETAATAALACWQAWRGDWRASVSHTTPPAQFEKSAGIC